MIYTSRDHVAPNAIHRRLSRIENKPVSKEINKVEGDSDGAGQQARLARGAGVMCDRLLRVIGCRVMKKGVRKGA